MLVAGAAAAAEPLVDSAWLKARLGTPGLVVLDVTSNPAVFARGHIPGAVYTHYGKDGWRVDGKKNGRKVAGVLPPIPRLEQLIGGLGIGNDDHVVIVANGFSAAEMGTATRIYWTFKVLGHDPVSILNGGMVAWRADKANPLEANVTKPAPKTFTAAFRPELIATTEDVRLALANGTALIDSRPADQYLGLNKSGSVSAYGTLPRAVSVPGAYMTVNGGGEIRDAGAMRQLYAMSQAPTDGEAITFCNTGHWASLGWFVNSEILGNKNTAMYDGSMADWTTEDDAPVERKVKLD
ncbi:MAG: sulfurtransferase [Rhodospirillales bacterium]|nr:MAG: sulfurtransferase [Rhodospirillales bacterium]